MSESAASLISRFECAAGTVRGRDHELSGKNNQDAFASFQSDSLIAFAVSDGCGSGKHSEVGSKLAARILVEALRKSAEELGRNDALLDNGSYWEELRIGVIDSLNALVVAMGGSRTQTVSDYFLFTLLGAVVTPARTAVFSMGDGVIALNGAVERLGPFPGNQPPYLAYGGLVGSSVAEENPELVRFRVKTLPTAELRSILAATDGAEEFLTRPETLLSGRAGRLGGVEQFWSDDAWFRNPDMIRRRLFLANKESVFWSVEENRLLRTPGLLRDDTTIAVLRRRKTPAASLQTPDSAPQTSP